MFRSIRAALLVVVLVLVFLAGVVLYGAIHTSRPRLPSTSMTGLRLDTYVYSLRKLRTAAPDNPVSIALSPTETSFLVEKFPPDLSWGRFRFLDSYLESAGDRIRILAVYQGPIGLYYKLDYRGTMQDTGEEWRLSIASLKLGRVPVTWFVSSTKVYDRIDPWDAKIKVREATLDGKGLRGEFTRFDVELTEILTDA